MEEPGQKRGRKRGKQQEQKKPERASKRSKKESVEHTLNSTFSVDEDERDPNETVTLPVVTSIKAKEPRKMRGRKKAYLTEESSANESENDKPPAAAPENEEKIEQPTAVELEVPALEDKNDKPTANVEKVTGKKKKKLSASKVDAIPPARKLKKSTSAPSEQPTEPEKIAVKRTRSSSGKISPVTEKIPVKKILLGKAEPVEPEVMMPVNKKLVASKRISNGSPAVTPKQTAPSPVDKRVALLKTSTHPVRSRKLTQTLSSTPAKVVALTPAASAKKAVQFNAATNIPKLTKPKAAPNFAEIHQKNFLKMQSVDEYVEKKRARTETMSSAKTVRTKSVLNNATPQAKPVVTKSKTPENVKFNFVSGKKDKSFSSRRNNVLLYLTSSFLQGLQKPVFTAKGQVVNEKQRVMATVKENLHNASQQQHIPAATGKRKASTLNMSREINASKLSLAGKQILKGVRTNRRFGK